MTTDQAAELISQLPPVAQEVFIRQWNECTTSWDFTDWFDRIAATLEFYRVNEWDGIRWQPRGVASDAT